MLLAAEQYRAHFLEWRLVSISALYTLRTTTVRQLNAIQHQTSLFTTEGSFPISQKHHQLLKKLKPESDVNMKKKIHKQKKECFETVDSSFDLNATVRWN